MHQVATGNGASHPFIIPLTKIDVERRLVIGTAAEEIADKSKEIMDYASARPQFEEWSNGFSAATGGLSKGNLRVMHTKTVAGRLDAIEYDDASKRVQIVAKVSDDNEWRKCLDGAYTGFSIGGGYLKKWKDPESGLIRYTPIVREISLVDNPCMPTAVFAELVKADGIVEQLELHGVVRGFAQAWSERPMGFADAWATRPQTFGDVYQASVKALAKRAVPKRRVGDAVELPRDWSADKHPRSPNGKFSGGGGSATPELASAMPMKAHPLARAMLSPADQALEPAKQKEWDEAHSPDNRQNAVAAAAEAAGGASFATGKLINAAPKLWRGIKHGFGAAGERNSTADMLRGRRSIRTSIVAAAHKKRVAALDGGPKFELHTNSVQRKIMQEAAERGSSLDDAKIEAAKWNAIMRRKVPGHAVGDLFVNGKPTTYTDKATAGAADRAAREAIHGLSDKAHFAMRRAPGGYGRLALTRALSVPIGMAAGALGAQSAYRNQREEDGDGVTAEHHALANAGDALRSMSSMSLGQTLGAVAAIPVSLHRQGVRPQVLLQHLRNPSNASGQALMDHLGRVNITRTGRAMGVGALVGGALGLARTAPALYREYSARHGSGQP